MAEETLLYGGRAIATFHAGKHYYVVAVPDLGIRKLYQPGVTTIIGMKDKSGPLLPWAVGMMTTRVKELAKLQPDPIPRQTLFTLLDSAEDSYRDAKQEAADIGSLVHRVLEQALLGTFDASMLPLKADALLAPDLTPEMVELANNAIAAGLAFFSQYTIKVLATERVVWSPTYGFIGTTDLLAEVDGETCILDFKTAKRPYPENFIQLAAYQTAISEEKPELEITKRWVVRVGKDGKLMAESRDNSTLEEDFICFRALHRVWQWERQNGRFPKEPIEIVGNLRKLLEAIGGSTQG